MKLVPMAVLAAALMIGLTACSDDDDDTKTTANALVRVGHFSPDAPNVDVYVDGARVLRDVPYTALSDYLEVPGGERQIKVTPANQSTPVVIDAAVDVTAGLAYTVAASDLLAEITPVVLNDDRAPASGGAKVRFVHLSPDAPAVDILNAANGGQLFGDVVFKESTAYATIPAGTYTLNVLVTGTSTIALTVPGVAVESGKNYTIFARGLAGSGTLAAQAAVDTP